MIGYSRTPRRLWVWNWWLWKVYGQRTLIGGILSRAGFSSEEVAKLETEHLEAYLNALLEYVGSVDKDSKDSTRRHAVMVRHYGLATGRRETLQSIANDYQLSRERIRQLVEKRLGVFKREPARDELQAKIIAQARQMLDQA